MNLQVAVEHLHANDSISIAEHEDNYCQFNCCQNYYATVNLLPTGKHATMLFTSLPILSKALKNLDCPRYRNNLATC